MTGSIPQQPPSHHRRSIRLQGYDYSQRGAYFITICTKGRECLFGEIVDGLMRSNQFGQIAQAEWLRTGVLRPGVTIDAFAIMPNHMHGIILLVGSDIVGATRRVAPTTGTGRAAHTNRPTGPVSRSMGAIIGQFKSTVAKRINRIRGTPGTPVWQRNYYEHIIRNETSLDRLREYILTNAQRWEMDTENPHRTLIDPLDSWLKTEGKMPISRRTLI